MKIRTCVLGALVAGVVATANAETFLVNKTDDDGSPHTLRWAILQNNANPGGNRIQIVPTGNPKTPWVIKLNSILPPIQGPATVVGHRARVQ